MTPLDVDTTKEKRLLLRQAFGKFPTGVTVVTSRDGSGKPIGFTANSYTSVSIEPALLLVCLAKTSSNLQNFEQAETFAINVLSEGQREVSNRFASRVEDRFSETPWNPGRHGTPLIESTSAWFECRTDNVVDAGDHIILIGLITEFGISDENPLAYLSGHYLDLKLGEQVANSVVTKGGIRVGALLSCADQILLQSKDDGWTIPLGKNAPNLREARSALAEWLAEIGVGATIGLLYSVFDSPDGDETWLVFLGELESISKRSDLELFDVQDIPLNAVDTKYFRSILRRFQTEQAQSRFGVYVDDAHQSGAVHTADRDVTPWTKFIATQEAGS